MKYLVYILLCSCLGLVSCKKYLDKKSNESQSKPETLNDLQALLDNPSLSRGMRLINNSTDEYYLDYAFWNGRAKIDKDSYVWDANLNDFIDWRDIYITVLYANTVLDNLKDISSDGQQSQWNNIKGQALFFRAHSFYMVGQLYAEVFDPSIADLAPGIPLRLNSNFNEASSRHKLAEIYDQIEKDISEAIGLLGDNSPATALYKKRPTRAACYGLLSRIYLIKKDYKKAEENASLCLNQYNFLLNYNNSPQVDTLTAVNPPFAAYNGEMIFYFNVASTLNANTSAKIDSNLFKSYADSDLRKKLYFRKNTDPSYRYRGSYTGLTTDIFNGIATDEIYLNRAEAHARLGNTTNAMDDLNTLLKNRIRTSQFVPLTAMTPDQALNLVINERRKELVNRGLRWTDLRRLNKEPVFRTTLQRKLNNQIYELQPEDKRYTLLIPVEVMNNSNLQQNPR